MASHQVVMLPGVVDWTSGAARKALASITQACNLAIRRCNRVALRGGKGKLVAAKELNNSAAAGTAANQQWRGNRALTGLAAHGEGIRPPRRGVPRETVSFAFAALPLLADRAAQSSVVLPGDGVPCPMPAQDSPSFAATPVMQQAASVHKSDFAPAAGRAVSATRDSRRVRSPMYKFATLAPRKAAKPATRHLAGRQLRDSLLGWARMAAAAAAPAKVALAEPAPTTVSEHNQRAALLRYAALA